MVKKLKARSTEGAASGAFSKEVRVTGDSIDLPGYFGASTGGAAALWAAAELGSEISAVVSRGGRPDLAMPRLKDVIAFYGSQESSAIS